MKFCLFLSILLFASKAKTFNGKTIKEKVTEMIEIYNITFGVSSSAFQYEGAWNEPDKEETMWRHFTHAHPEMIMDRSNADISGDSNHNLERDINMLKFLGVQFYRLSISWSRLLPTPILHDGVSQEALQYYHSLIDLLIANNITPIVTLSHFDLPIAVNDIVGWTNAVIIDYFEHFVRIVFDNFADKVNVWVTINQIDVACAFHYGFSKLPPIQEESGVAVYLCLRNTFLAHAKAYHLYKQEYNGQGLVGIDTKLDWAMPMSNSTEDLEFIRMFRKILYGIYWDPIYSEHGDYPEIFKKTVEKKSLEQGYHKSRLTLFTKDEVKYIRNTSDFLGLNYYSPYRIYTNPKSNSDSAIGKVTFNIKPPSFLDDINYYFAPPDPNWEPTENTRIFNYPEGLKEILLFIKNTYNNPRVFILENGCAIYRDTLDNYDCLKYYRDHLHALHDAVVNEGCNVQLYGVWSLMDTFEWIEGYTMKFGLFRTNFTDAKRSTQPRATAYFFKELLQDLNVSKDLFLSSNENQSSSSSKLENNILYLLLIYLVLIKL